MAPKDPVKKTPSAASGAKKAKPTNQSKKPKDLPVNKQPKTKKAAVPQKTVESETPEKKAKAKAKLHVPQIVTQTNLKLILKQIDSNRVFSSGSGGLILGMINHVADELIKMSFEARPIKRPTCTREDVAVALRSFLPLVQDGQDGFRHHMKEAIDKYFRNMERIKAHEAALRAEMKAAAAAQHAVPVEAQ